MRPVRHKARAWLLVAFATCVLVTPKRSTASDTNYQSYVTGGRAAGLGGAFTGLGNDPSGLLFNPAGLVDDKHTDVSLSANLYGFERTERGDTPPSPIPDLRNIAQVATDLVIIPSTSGAVRTFQKSPNGDGYENALAAVVLVPSYRESSETLTRTGSGATIDYRRKNRDRLLMPGIGYGRKLGSRWRVGVSTFFMLRTVESTENITSYSLGEPSAFRIADSTVSLTSGSLLWVLGAKWFASDSFSLGLSFAPPSLQIFSSTNVRYYRGGFDPSGTQPSEFTPVVRNGLDSHYVYPATLRMGGAYVSGRKFTIAADLSLHFPVSYDLMGDANLSGILPFVTRVDRRAVLNLNVGGEWLFIPKMSVSAGFYTDFASSQTLSGPNYEGILSEQRLANIDYYGVSAALGYYGLNTLTRVGVLYSFGRGYDVVTRDDFGRLLQENNSFERVEQFKSFLYIFVSSSVRFD